MAHREGGSHGHTMPDGNTSQGGENIMLINVCISLFIILELANVLTLYFNPDTKLFNGMGAFRVWDILKDDDRYGDFVHRHEAGYAGARTGTYVV